MSGRLSLPMQLPNESRLSVLELGPVQVNRRARVRCECGTEKWIQLAAARSGHTLSCGCLQRERSGHNARHFKTPWRLYQTWINMRQRTTNPRRPDWKFYGAKGIRICPEWDDFVAFRAWALENGYSDDLTIDRIDASGNYEPGNCRWITRAENARRARRTAA